MDRSIIAICYQLMKRAHYGQVDKSGRKYMWHPLTVAHNVYLYFARYLSEDEYTIAICTAYLHDVLEDCEYYTQEKLLEEEVPFEIVSRVQILTRGEDESYMNFIRRCNDDKITRIVKMCDLYHNMDLTRLDKITDEDLQRVKKYHKAYKYLENTDNQELNELGIPDISNW